MVSSLTKRRENDIKYDIIILYMLLIGARRT